MNYKPGDFAVIPNINYALNHLSHSELKMYILLCKHADRSTGVCFPNNRTLADAMGFSNYKSVSPITSRLESVGLIVKTSNFRKDGSQTSNSFQLKLVEGEGVVKSNTPPSPTAMTPSIHHINTVTDFPGGNIGGSQEVYEVPLDSEGEAQPKTPGRKKQTPMVKHAIKKLKEVSGLPILRGRNQSDYAQRALDSVCTEIVNHHPEAHKRGLTHKDYEKIPDSLLEKTFDLFVDYAFVVLPEIKLKTYYRDEIVNMQQLSYHMPKLINNRRSDVEQGLL